MISKSKGKPGDVFFFCTAKRILLIQYRRYKIKRSKRKTKKALETKKIGRLTRKQPNNQKNKPKTQLLNSKKPTRRAKNQRAPKQTPKKKHTA